MAKFLCPICGERLLFEEHALRCSKGHSFDKAKSGYVNLIPINRKRSKMPGDNREMVEARRAFLDKGYYAPFAKAVGEAAARHFGARKKPVLLDAGCGEGYYTAAVGDSLPNGEIFAVDISKFAADKCAKRCPKAHCAAASVFRLPMEDGSCDGVLSLFSPYCGEEYRRVLRPGGLFLMGIPGRFHLWELKAALYDKPYENEVKDFELQGFTFVERVPVEGHISLPCNEDIANLFKMTPYYYKSGVDTDEKLAALKQLDTRISFELLIYRA